MKDNEYYSQILILLKSVKKPLLKKGKKPEVQQALNAFNKLIEETEARINK